VMRDIILPPGMDGMGFVQESRHWKMKNQ